MDAAALARELVERGQADGFDAVRVSRVAPLERDATALSEWLARDRHAGMSWMGRGAALRADPRRVLPGCESVVSVAMNYWPGDEAAAIPAGRAKVALYARGRDYHRVMGRKLGSLASWLATATGLPARSRVDTGPVLERAWAERSGLGWIGKNANLLTRAVGSWVMLGEILSVAAVEPSPGPHADFCGSCRACIDACPTGAIVAPGVVDSRLCISYWTIEHRGAIPEERRAAFGEWIFGCDDCQTACPWNRRFARRASDPFSMREDLRGLDAEDVLALDERSFRARFSGTALMRARWDGMRRNACLVIANRPGPGARKALRRAIEDTDPVVRSHAAWALGVGPSHGFVARRAGGEERKPKT